MLSFPFAMFRITVSFQLPLICCTERGGGLCFLAWMHNNKWYVRNPPNKHLSFSTKLNLSEHLKIEKRSDQDCRTNSDSQWEGALSPSFVPFEPIGMKELQMPLTRTIDESSSAVWRESNSPDHLCNYTSRQSSLSWSIYPPSFGKDQLEHLCKFDLPIPELQIKITHPLLHLQLPLALPLILRIPQPKLTVRLRS